MGRDKIKHRDRDKFSILESCAHLRPGKGMEEFTSYGKMLCRQIQEIGAYQRGKVCVHLSARAGQGAVAEI